MQIKPLKELTKEALIELKLLQDGKKKLVKTGFEAIDSHIGGMLGGDILILSGLSGHGKSESVFELKDNFLDEKINPDAKDFVTLEINLELKIFNVVIRALHRRMTKSKKKILFEGFNDEEKQICEHYFNSTQDDRQYLSQTPSTPEELAKGLDEFLSQHTDKKAVLIILDHILLLSGADKKGVIDTTMEILNQLKLKYSNVYFCVVSQLNRSVLARVSDKNNSATPTSADLYGSEFMQQAASYSLIVFNAYKVGIHQFMKVNPDFYEYLSDHFGETDSKGKVSFNTMGKLFQIVTKVREGEAVFKDIFIKDMRMDESTKKILTENKASTIKLPEFNINTTAPLEPPQPKVVFDMTQAFDIPTKAEDGDPF